MLSPAQHLSRRRISSPGDGRGCAVQLDDEAFGGAVEVDDVWADAVPPPDFAPVQPSVLSYLVLIDEVEVLPALYGDVLIPQEVAAELRHPQGPATIRLAVNVNASLIVMDEKAGRRVARQLGLSVTGMIGILDVAASDGRVDIVRVIERLRETSFRTAPFAFALRSCRPAFARDASTSSEAGGHARGG